MATSQQHPDASKKSSSVLVIGAGMSGLCAAKSLTNASYTNVTILEARSHIGGRTVTKEIGNSGVMVDAGAAWMHGTKHNPLVDMCDHYGTAIVEVGDDNVRTAWTAEDAEYWLHWHMRQLVHYNLV